MKLIAKTRLGTEFLHSRRNAFFAPDSSAVKIARVLNTNQYQIKEGEIWHVYDYDYSQSAYVDKHLYIRSGIVKAKYI